MASPHGEFALDTRAALARKPRVLRARGTGERSGQSVGEIAMIGLALLILVVGTVDFGRAIYVYARFEHSVREAARYGRTNPTATGEIEAIVLANGTGLDIRPDDIDVSCAGDCNPGSADITVFATARFTPITAKLLGIGPDDLPIRLHASASATS